MLTVYVEWTATNKAEESTTVQSSVVTVDATPPLIDYVHDTFRGSVPYLGGQEADVVGSTELDVGCMFSARDLESGLATTRWCLGTFPGACDVYGPIAVDARLRETQQSVGSLINQVRYYSLITVHNNAGNWQSAISDGFTIDVSPPACAEVYDGPGYDRQYVGPTNARVTRTLGEDGATSLVGEMVTSWSGFTDFTSGIGGYAVTVVPSSMRGLLNGSTDDSIGLANSASFRLELHHAETYYGAVSVWDNLINIRVCYSDGVLYDDTPPSVSNATLASHLGLTPTHIQVRSEHTSPARTLTARLHAARPSVPGVVFLPVRLHMSLTLCTHAFDSLSTSASRISSTRRCGGLSTPRAGCGSTMRRLGCRATERAMPTLRPTHRSARLERARARCSLEGCRWPTATSS